ncbi:MAG TPA: DUF885 domain-containing protein [Gemmatimonadales bacterium]|nr:DUF885 domain-containing protein [Gemmatimonadales bacterium]
MRTSRSVVLAATVAIPLVHAALAAQHPTPLPDAPALRALAHAYYEWRDTSYPVGSSDQGRHTWDDRLTDYSHGAVLARRRHVADLLARVRATPTTGWSRDDRIDWLLFRAQLEGVAFFGRVMSPEETDPQVYVGECSNAIFSLLKKDYAPHRARALAASARLRKMPALLAQGDANLVRPVRLYAQLGIEAARSIDDLFEKSLMTLADSLTPVERADLERARDSALAAIHAFADRLERRLPAMVAWRPMGEANYNYLLKHVYLLPLDASDVAMLGEAELARFRGQEAMLPNPALASPDPARAARIPKDQEEFLAAYQAREREMLDYLTTNRLVTLPSYLGPFLIRQLPEAFKPTSPGGFMNPSGIYDADSSGFYFIPTYNPASGNFYIRAAVEDPRPILGHEGIPGHFLQLSIAKHLTDEIRRQHLDGVFVEGWAFYTEEMLLRRGMYGDSSAGGAQVLRLGRYRAARIGVDVNLQTGRWTFDQAAHYFQEAGGLDSEAARGEAAGAASSPSQKITYMVGKWQIQRLLGAYRDRHPDDFRIGAFHDQLLSYGSLPLSVVQWLMLGDSTAAAQVSR